MNSVLENLVEVGFLDGQIAYSHSPCRVSPVNIFPGTFVLQVINILYFFSFVTMQCKVPECVFLAEDRILEIANFQLLFI